jgi:two-component system, NtrC family, nitrogen regulation sensor histidine kinase NtrY
MTQVAVATVPLSQEGLGAMREKEDGTRPVLGAALRGPPQGTSRGLAFWLGISAVCLALVSGIATSLILTGSTRIRPTNDVFQLVILLNILMVLPLITVIAWQVWRLWHERRHQAAGSRLHIRIVGLFGVIALLPTILLATFAALSLNRALDQVFSKQVRNIVTNSQLVANAYVEEHAKILRGDVVAMARDLDAAATLVKSDPARFKALFTAQAGLRDLSMGYLIEPDGKILLAPDQPSAAPYLEPPASALAEAASGQPVLIEPGRSTRVGAIQKLSSFKDTYLFVTRAVDASVIRQLRLTEDGVRRYSEIDHLSRGIKIASAVIYVVIALTLLLAAIWLGLWFANRLVAPIRRLIGAAQLVSQGNLNVQVPVRRGESDLKVLSTTFNRMTSELKTQRDELVSTNSQLQERRRFIEAVLSGVTAGIIGLDQDGVINLANPSAERLLGRSAGDLVGNTLESMVPEFAALSSVPKEEDEAGATRRPSAPVHHSALLPAPVTVLVNGTERTFAVRRTTEQDAGTGEDPDGTVVTFDDITELVVAQRTSAWADIARRIAHEIKNPLTPIQLSAERLKRRYGASITDDREVFDKCISTIIRQVGDIGRMVDEFSSFARMPKPEMAMDDVRQVVRESVILYEVGRTDIDVTVKVPDAAVHSYCDRRLLSQVLTNLIKNASEAIQPVAESKDAPPGYRGRIQTRLTVTDKVMRIEVEDNGVGLPKQNRGRLVEPYVTTRAKGTGLGLAIVQKIVEQHGGTLVLEDAPSRDGQPARGAVIVMTMPQVQGPAAGAPTVTGAASLGTAGPPPGAPAASREQRREASAAE